MERKNGGGPVAMTGARGEKRKHRRKGRRLSRYEEDRNGGGNEFEIRRGKLARKKRGDASRSRSLPVAASVVASPPG